MKINNLVYVVKRCRYPSDVDKHILARQTGLSRSQVRPHLYISIYYFWFNYINIYIYILKGFILSMKKMYLSTIFLESVVLPSNFTSPTSLSSFNSFLYKIIFLYKLNWVKQKMHKQLMSKIRQLYHTL